MTQNHPRKLTTTHQNTPSDLLFPKKIRNNALPIIRNQQRQHTSHKNLTSLHNDPKLLKKYPQVWATDLKRATMT